MLGEDALAQELEGRVCGYVEQVARSAAERRAGAGGRPPTRSPGSGRSSRAEHRLPLCLRPDQYERVVRHADERRREHPEERLVVVAVVEEPEIREEVCDLLLPEVVAPRGAVGRQADSPQLLLEPLGVGAGGEEHDDLARRGHPRVDELAHTPGDVSRLRAAPVDAGLRGRRLVGDEQLERVPQRGTSAPSAGSSRWNSSPNSPPNSSFTAASTSGRERWFRVRGSTVGAALRRSRNTATSACRKP